ncbi:hypothetical protein [Myceligenerans indicum]|uniref:Uncharacterized protein n=1 Tax=Myceligenerans indicum TaxID=2593663 RepID=A0ABS1LLZ4_9MICO|nr:hypothetical protein [Myceligenerans indicum]MBL0887049.1 hypothetical protein [Myceligenerans indicum]
MSDLHVLTQVAHDEPGWRRGRSAILAVALVLVVAVVVGLLAALVRGSREEARAEAALGRSTHAAGDCGAADRHLKAALDSGTVPFLDPPVDRSALRAEITACEELERARHLAERAQYREAVDGFESYLDSGVARYVNALREKSEARIALARQLEDQGAELRAVHQYAAVMTEAPGSPSAETAQERVWALYAGQVERARKKQPCRAVDAARAWSELDGAALEPVRTAADDALSWSLLRCGEARIDRGRAAARDARYRPDVFTAARSVLTQAAERYPGTEPGRLARRRLDTLPAVTARAQGLAAEVASERRRVAGIRRQVVAALRDGDSLPRPRRTGDGGSEVRLRIRNATGHPLYVAWTGEDTDATTIPAGGTTCAKARTVTLTLTPGAYSLAVREGDDWAAGAWSFPSRNFTTCVT